MVWFAESPESQGISHPDFYTFHNSKNAKMCTCLSHERGQIFLNEGDLEQNLINRRSVVNFVSFYGSLSMEQFRTTAIENHTSCPWLSSTVTLFFRKLRAVKLLYLFRLWQTTFF